MAALGGSLHVVQTILPFYTSRSILIALRHKTTAHGNRKVNLWEEYNNLKHRVEGQPLPSDVDSEWIFANNELDLSGIDVYGFDYDYTLASYKEQLHFLLYSLGKEALVNKSKYPKAISSFQYDPKFAVRGLHYHVEESLLMKIDAFHNIQLGTVYRGLQSVSQDEVISLFGGTHVPLDMMNTFHGQGRNMYQLMDLFALPEITLLANVIEYFRSEGIPYDPSNVFYDVRGAVQGVHQSGELHQKIMADLDTYLEKPSEVAQLLQRLSSAGKKLFLITNSGFPFVDKGMKFMLGKEWTDLFDVVIVTARKPKFFNEPKRPFRIYNTAAGMTMWDRVTEFKKGTIYQEGNLIDFQKLTGWYGSKVLYFGDHVYTDLADPTLKLGWRTGAIIPELEKEINIINSEQFKDSVRWLLALQGLIERTQMVEGEERVRKQWIAEREQIRVITKQVFNPRFGSLFRTYHNQSYFSRRLHRFADVYMSHITNLMNYPLHYTFYPRRAALPHEFTVKI